MGDATRSEKKNDKEASIPPGWKHGDPDGTGKNLPGSGPGRKNRAWWTEGGARQRRRNIHIVRMVAVTRRNASRRETDEPERRLGRRIRTRYVHARKRNPFDGCAKQPQARHRTRSSACRDSRPTCTPLAAARRRRSPRLIRVERGRQKGWGSLEREDESRKRSRSSCIVRTSEEAPHARLCCGAWQLFLETRSYIRRTFSSSCIHKVHESGKLHRMESDPPLARAARGCHATTAGM